MPEISKQAEIHLLDLSPRVLANSITLRDFQLFQKIPTTSYIENLLKEDTPELIQFENVNNTELFWVVWSILQEQKPERRAKVIKYFLQLAQAFRNLKNLNSFFNVVFGLGNPVISRLKKTWEFVPQKWQKTLKDFEKFLDPSRNMSMYRSLLNDNKKDPPLIPFFPIVRKDLMFLHIGNDTKVDNLINFEKMRMFAKEVRAISNMAEDAGREITNLMSPTSSFDTGFSADTGFGSITNTSASNASNTPTTTDYMSSTLGRRTKLANINNANSINNDIAAAYGQRVDSLTQNDGGVVNQNRQKMQTYYEESIMVRKVKQYLQFVKEKLISHEDELMIISKNLEPPQTTPTSEQMRRKMKSNIDSISMASTHSGQSGDGLSSSNNHANNKEKGSDTINTNFKALSIASNSSGNMDKGKFRSLPKLNLFKEQKREQIRNLNSHFIRNQKTNEKESFFDGSGEPRRDLGYSTINHVRDNYIMVRQGENTDDDVDGPEGANHRSNAKRNNLPPGSKRQLLKNLFKRNKTTVTGLGIRVINPEAADMLRTGTDPSNPADRLRSGSSDGFYKFYTKDSSNFLADNQFKRNSSIRRRHKSSDCIITNDPKLGSKSKNETKTKTDLEIVSKMLIQDEEKYKNYESPEFTNKQMTKTTSKNTFTQVPKIEIDTSYDAYTFPRRRSRGAVTEFKPKNTSTNNYKYLASPNQSKYASKNNSRRTSNSNLEKLEEFDFSEEVEMDHSPNHYQNGQTSQTGKKLSPLESFKKDGKIRRTHSRSKSDVTSLTVADIGREIDQLTDRLKNNYNSPRDSIRNTATSSTAKVTVRNRKGIQITNLNSGFLKYSSKLSVNSGLDARDQLNVVQGTGSSKSMTNSMSDIAYGYRVEEVSYTGTTETRSTGGTQSASVSRFRSASGDILDGQTVRNRRIDRDTDRIHVYQNQVDLGSSSESSCEGQDIDQSGLNDGDSDICKHFEFTI